MLPGRDGFAVASELRQQQNFVPILMLTARGRPEDVLKGFAAGADDYLAKPAELAILLARIGGLLRRSAWTRNGARPEPRQDRFTFSGKTIDFDTLELAVGDRVLQLTLMEANLLRYLIEHEGKAISRKTMLEQVWGLHEDTDTRAIDNFVVRLTALHRKGAGPPPAPAYSPRCRLPLHGEPGRMIAFLLALVLAQTPAPADAVSGVVVDATGASVQVRS